MSVETPDKEEDGNFFTQLIAHFTGATGGGSGDIMSVIMKALFGFLGIPMPGGSGDDKTKTDFSGKTFVVIGDSIGRGLADNLPGKKINAAVDGASLTEPAPIEAGLKEVKEGHIAVIAMGTDDIKILEGQTPDQIKEYARRIVGIAEQVKAQGGTPFLLEVMEKSSADSPEKTAWNKTARELNAAMKVVAAEKGFEVMAVNGKAEVGSDGVHLTDKGETAISQTLQETLVARAAAAQKPAA